MAEVVELLLQEEVEMSAVLRWLQTPGDNQETEVGGKLAALSLLRKDFIPFLLNFLREQTSQILASGPLTPGKTSAQVRRAAGCHGNTVEDTMEMGKHSAAAPRGSCTQLLFRAPATSEFSFQSSNYSAFSRSSPSPGRSNLAGAVFQSSPSPVPRQGGERRSAQKVSLSEFIVVSPENQLQKKGRKKSSPGYSSWRQAAREVGGSLSEEERKNESPSLSGGRKRREETTAGSTVSSPPNLLNLDNLEEFPPVSATLSSAGKTKPSRRINPTPVSAERPLSKPKICFTSTPLSRPPVSTFQTGGSPEFLTATQDCCTTPGGGSNLQREREMLKKERFKILQQTAVPSGASFEPLTPTKAGYSRSASVPSDTQSIHADSSRVSYRKHLDLLAQLYSACIAENLVPNIFLELFFVLQLLTSRVLAVIDKGESSAEFTEEFKDTVERPYFSSVHNCVYFATKVLEAHFEIISHLDKGTLRLLAENERLESFSPELHRRLVAAYESTTTKVSLVSSSFIHSVPFHPETDDRSNFSSDKAFHIFKKQRDVFYELLREWEDNHKEPRWEFERAVGSRIRSMMAHLTAACTHSHFARLFQKQLVQMGKGLMGSFAGSDSSAQDVLNMLGADNLSRLKRLQERFIAPQSTGGPCPPPSFPGCQEFFRDFIVCAGSYQLNQHLSDSLCQQILELDGLALQGHESTAGETDVEEQDERVCFSSALMTARLLAKFLGFIAFLPYRTGEPLTRHIQESAVALRNQTAPVLDMYGLVMRSMVNRHTVLTVPWVVEFLSMVDHAAPFLDHYCQVFALLLRLYRSLVLSKNKEMSFLNKLLILAVLGWLFQVPSVPGELFFVNDAREEDLAVKVTRSAHGLDCVPLVDQQLLYTCCPYLSELRKLLASFVAGSGAKNGGFIRKITPTAAEPLVPTPPLSQQKLQAELEQAFFHNQPPSLRRTVEFVAERVGSNCVKHIKATLVAELVKRGEAMLQEGMQEEMANLPGVLDGVCSGLCEEGKEALVRGREYCCKKGPEAVRVLLPEETSASVLRTAEDITVRLATEKACTWLSTNITALITREVKVAFDRMLKSRLAAGPAVREASGGRMRHCCEGCEHNAPLPSEIITELKDVLCIAFGPRADDEQVDHAQLSSLIGRVSRTLKCRKYMAPVSEQLIVKCTVELGSLLISHPVVPSPAAPEPQANKNDEGELQNANDVSSTLLRVLLSLWKEDVCVPVPLKLLFSERNVAYLLDAPNQKWEMFLLLIDGLVEHGLMGYTEIQNCLRDLLRLPWPADFLNEMEAVLGKFKSLHVNEEQMASLELPASQIHGPDSRVETHR
ncbi:codanin-1 [Latimeria chalumnae]|uniref:codanin-1 n=1 Tax=Latimeria chalumnae TaxID=7897 RepID=UPI00313C7D0A